MVLIRSTILKTESTCSVSRWYGWLGLEVPSPSANEAGSVASTFVRQLSQCAPWFDAHCSRSRSTFEPTIARYPALERSRPPLWPPDSRDPSERLMDPEPS